MKKITSVRISFNELKQLDKEQLYDMVNAVQTYCENGRNADDAEIVKLTSDPVVAKKFDKYRRRIDRADEQSRKMAEKKEKESSHESGNSAIVDADGGMVQLPVEMRAVVMFTQEWVKDEIERLYAEGRNYVTIRFRKFLEKFLDCVCPYMPPYMDALQLGADRGDHHAQYEMGECYEFGRRKLPCDYEKALYWYRLSARNYSVAKMAIARIEGRSVWYPCGI